MTKHQAFKYMSWGRGCPIQTSRGASLSICSDDSLPEDQGSPTSSHVPVIRSQVSMSMCRGWYCVCITQFYPRGFFFFSFAVSLSVSHSPCPQPLLKSPCVCSLESSPTLTESRQTRSTFEKGCELLLGISTTGLYISAF